MVHTKTNSFAHNNWFDVLFEIFKITRFSGFVFVVFNYLVVACGIVCNFTLLVIFDDVTLHINNTTGYTLNSKMIQINESLLFLVERIPVENKSVSTLPNILFYSINSCRPTDWISFTVTKYWGHCSFVMYLGLSEYRDVSHDI